VLDAFAATDGTPAAINAGRLTNDPPPAKAFIAPAIKPAPAMSRNSFMPEMLTAHPVSAIRHWRCQVLETPKRPCGSP
jgi:hypothetical protein